MRPRRVADRPGTMTQHTPKQANVHLAGWYAFAFLHEFIPIYPLYGILFIETGLTPFQVSVLFSGWTVFSLLAEIPSGALADTRSRPALLASSSLFKAGGYLTWLAFPGFTGFMAGFLLWGISGALRSGTAESLLYDSLDARGRADEFTRIYGRVRACSVLAGGLAMAAGGALVRYGYPTVLLVGVGSLLVAALTASLAFRETGPRATSHSVKYLDTMRAGVGEALRNRTILFVVVVAGVLLPLPGAFDEFVGPVLVEAGFAHDKAAYFFALIYFAQTAGALTAHRIRGLNPYQLLLVLGVAGGVLLAAAWGAGWIIPVAMIIYFGLFALVQPLLAARFQDAIEGEARATATSVAGAAMGVGGIAIYLAFGGVATGQDLASGVLGVAVATIVFSAALVFLARRWRVRWEPVRRSI